VPVAVANRALAPTAVLVETLPPPLPTVRPDIEASLVDVKTVDVKFPVEGTKLNLVELVVCGKLPDVFETIVGYHVALELVLSVIAIFVAFVAVVADVALVAVVAVAALPPIDRPDAVPVKLVATPLDGVPNAPPLVTKAPAEPTFTAKAVATPVPKPLIPVETGNPVALVRTAAEGVPSAGVVKLGLVAKATTVPVPVVE